VESWVKPMQSEQRLHEVLCITMVVLKALMKTFEMNISDMTVVFWSTIHEEKNRSTNLDVVLDERNKSPTDEVF
jgi:hypothetical protein